MIVRTIDFEKEVVKKRLENMDTLKREIMKLPNDSDLMKKVVNQADRYGLPVSYVIDNLKYGDDDMILNGFEKDPGRQNIYEDLQLKYAKEMPCVMDVGKLPSGGKNAKYIQDGKIVGGSKFVGKKSGTKSLDLSWHFDFMGESLYFYSTCKYTKDEGGAQDNQRNDVITFFKEAQKITDKNIFCVGIVDGEYYDRPRDKGASWREIFNSEYYGPRCIATDSEHLPTVVRDIICEWLNCRGYIEKAKEITDAFSEFC